jgi:pimeloyl-ACP methyl ester carboxylesterase
LRWHHECGKTKRIGAGESEAWFNPRRALTVAGRSGRCGIGVRRWIEPLADLSRVSGGPGVVSDFADLLSSRDRELLDDQRYTSAFAETVCEGLRQGTSGAGWDNVSWIGEWDIDLSAVCCPVLLWHGSDDRFCQPAHTDCGCQRICPARGSPCVTARGISGFMNTSARCSTLRQSPTRRTRPAPGNLSSAAAVPDIRYPALCR